MKYVIDSFSWIEYLIASSKGAKIKEIIESESNEIYTSIISIAEIASITKRENRDVEEADKTINRLSKIYAINPKFAKEAGLLHAEIRKDIKDFGLADAIILLAARKIGAKVLTGDEHFKNFKEAILIKD